MMERRDEEFGNDISVQDVVEDEDPKDEDWHKSFLANYDRLSFVKN